MQQREIVLPSAQPEAECVRGRARLAARVAFRAIASIALVMNLLGATAPDRASLGLSFDTGWSHDENSGDGYSYFRSSVFVDCANTRVGYRQSADILTGAYAHRADGSVSSYADMGVILQNDALAPGELGRPNKVQLYAQASTGNGSQLLRYASNGAAHDVYVACDTKLTYTFWVASAHELDLRYDGTFVEKKTHRRFTGSERGIVAGFADKDGWTITCERCAVRRAVTLAVGSGEPTRPGSYVGIIGDGNHRAPAIAWSNSVEGRYRPERGMTAGDAASYDLRPFAAAKRDIVNSPYAGESTPATAPAFLVTHEGAADEHVGLDERGEATP